MKRVILLDFDDSFIFNILSDLKRLNIEGEVVHWKKINKLKLSPHTKNVIIYGPGPGHPHEYKSIYPKIEKWLKEKNLFHLGICLGHQLLWNINGCAIKNSIKPMHGQPVSIKIPKWDKSFPKEYWDKIVTVQRYNSLGISSEKIIDHFVVDEEYQEPMVGRGKNFITYQFHPESVGTSCRKLFFNPIIEFLGNI
ncbi:MAG: hypothetical protein U0T83_09400 [Bacteriovoracaceae bacterium]